MKISVAPHCFSLELATVYFQTRLRKIQTIEPAKEVAPITLTRSIITIIVSFVSCILQVKVPWLWNWCAVGTAKLLAWWHYPIALRTAPFRSRRHTFLDCVFCDARAASRAKFLIWLKRCAALLTDWRLSDGGRLKFL